MQLSTCPCDRDRGRELVREDLHDDHSAEDVVPSDEYRRHPSTAKFAIEGVRGAEGTLELVSENGHVSAAMLRVKSSYDPLTT